MEFRVRSLSSQSDWTSDSGLGRATNCDTGDDCEVNANVIFDEDKIPIEYTCRPYILDDDSIGLSETKVSVDYEALLPLVADAEANERLLQWRVLLAAVKEVGLDKCDFDQQRFGKGESNGQRQLFEQEQTSRGLQPNSTTTTLQEPTTLFAIRSDLESSSQFEIPCLNLEPDRVSECIPVRTVLTLKYQGDPLEATTVQDYVKNLLERHMVDRTEELYVRDVEGLQYVGTFDLAYANRPTDDSPNIAPTSNTGGDSVMRVGTIVSAASALVLLVFLFAFRRKAPIDDDEEETVLAVEKMGTANDILLDLESGESGKQHPHHDDGVPTMPTNPSSSSSDIGASSSGDSSDLQQEQGPPLIYSKSSEEADNADDEKDIMMDLDSMKSLSQDSGEYPLTATASSITVPTSNLETHALPPRPPRRESVQLKKHRKRRKKKKKKKPTLTRINSREKINAMEAIPETADDGSEFETSEDGSEYEEDSTDDDSNLSSSTSSTPVRSLPGCRSTSPRSSFHNSNSSLNNSNQNNNPSNNSFFPPNAFVQDFNFVIEALDFPFGRNSENNINSGNNFLPASLASSWSSSLREPSEQQQQGTTPPTITKEKRIRPIPPPPV